MKKFGALIMGVLFGLAGSLWAQQQDIDLGKVYFPADFIHADKTFNKGFYRVALTSKDNVYYFDVFNLDKELLFEELAVVKTEQASGAKLTYRVRKELLKDNEYFRIRVIEPERLIMAYFLVKKEEAPSKQES